MLRARTRRTTGSSSVTLSVTHGLGAVPDLWLIEPVSDVSQGLAYVLPGTVATNVLHLTVPISVATLDVFTINYQGRLY